MSEEKVLRWETFERCEHALLMIILFMFIISGLPFLSRSWFGWMTSPPVTLQVYMGMHLAAAALYFALGLVHIFYHALGKRRTDIWISRKDIADAWQTIKYYVGSVDEMPKFKFHEPTEKIGVLGRCSDTYDRARNYRDYNVLRIRFFTCCKGGCS